MNCDPPAMMRLWVTVFRGGKVGHTCSICSCLVFCLPTPLFSVMHVRSCSNSVRFIGNGEVQSPVGPQPAPLLVLAGCHLVRRCKCVHFLLVLLFQAGPVVTNDCYQQHQRVARCRRPQVAAQEAFPSAASLWRAGQHTWISRRVTFSGVP
jgi:hypothetical protein